MFTPNIDSIGRGILWLPVAYMGSLTTQWYVGMFDEPCLVHVRTLDADISEKQKTLLHQTVCPKYSYAPLNKWCNTLGFGTPFSKDYQASGYRIKDIDRLWEGARSVVEQRSIMSEFQRFPFKHQMVLFAHEDDKRSAWIYLGAIGITNCAPMFVTQKYDDTMKVVDTCGEKNPSFMASWTQWFWKLFSKDESKLQIRTTHLRFDENVQKSIMVLVHEPGAQNPFFENPQDQNELISMFETLHGHDYNKISLVIEIFPPELNDENISAVYNQMRELWRSFIVTFQREITFVIVTKAPPLFNYVIGQSMNPRHFQFCAFEKREDGNGYALAMHTTLIHE